MKTDKSSAEFSDVSNGFLSVLNKDALKRKKIARAKNIKFMNKTFGKAIMAPAGL